MTRRLVAAAGLGALAFGLEQLLTVGPAGQVVNALVWLVAVLIVHDGLLGPLAAVTGRLLTRLGRRGAGWGAAVPVVGVGLWIGVALTLLALPTLLSPGVADNATVLPRGYGAGLATLLAVDAAVTASIGGILSVRGRRRARSVRRVDVVPSVDH